MSAASEYRHVHEIERLRAENKALGEALKRARPYVSQWEWGGSEKVLRQIDAALKAAGELRFEEGGGGGGE